MQKKLLHIVLYLPFGGLEKIVYDFSVALNGKGYEVHVAALQEGGPMQNLLEDADIPVHVLGKRPGKIDVNLLYRLVKLIRQLKVDIIHSHSGCIMYAALAGRIAGVTNIIHTEHGRYLPEPMSRILEDRIFSKLIYKYVCVSRELTNYMLSTVKIPYNKLTTIINGIDTIKFHKYNQNSIYLLKKKYGIPLNKIVIGTVCRLIPEKNVTFLINWLLNKLNEYNELIIIVIGDGPQFNLLKQMTNHVSEDRIRLLGSRHNIDELLNLFDVFVLPSLTEGTSLTILEAMSTGLPVIVTNIPGNKDIVTHQMTGMLFECNNNIAFEKCLKEVLSDNCASGKQMGIRAQLFVQDNYSFNNMINHYLSLYE